MYKRTLQAARRIKSKLSPATVLAFTALFVALGGSAYAAGTINGADIIDGSTPLSKLNKPVVEGTAKMGNRTVMPNVADPSLFTLPGFGTITIYHAAPSDNENYCASDPSAGGQGDMTYTNISNKTESFFFEGGKHDVLPSDTMTLATSTSAIIVKGNKQAKLDIQGSSVFDAKNALFTSCSYAWAYWTSN